MKLNLSAGSALAAIAISAFLPGAASAALVVDSVADNPGAAADPFITLGAIQDTDFLQITGNGQIFLQNGPEYGVNAAGVIITPGNGGGVGDSGNFSGPASQCPIASCTFGSLLATLTLPGDSFSQTVQVFLPTTANGAGTASPPQSLTYTGTWGGLFGNFADTTGGTLTFSIADTIYSDNSGQFSVTAIPEPAAWLLLMGGVGLMGIAMRTARRQVTPAAA